MNISILIFNYPDHTPDVIGWKTLLFGLLMLAIGLAELYYAIKHPDKNSLKPPLLLKIMGITCIIGGIYIICQFLKWYFESH